jgi:hypothetical protein
MEGNGYVRDGVRVELVTATFVACGVPEGIRDLGRFLENLNNPAIARHIELHQTHVRPLYRAASPLVLDVPLLVRRDEIVFATFEGPHIEHEVVRTATDDSPCLLLAPPFQIQGVVSFAPGVVASQALRPMLATFFTVRQARVYDAEGDMLGQGEQIVVNGAAVQMVSPTSRHIETYAERAGIARRAARAQAVEVEDIEITPREQERVERAA